MKTWCERGNNLFTRGDDFCAIMVDGPEIEIINWNPDNYPQLGVHRFQLTETLEERSRILQEELAGWKVVLNNHFTVLVDENCCIRDLKEEASDGPG